MIPKNLKSLIRRYPVAVILSGHRHHCRHLAGNLFDIGPTSYDPAGQRWGNKKLLQPHHLERVDIPRVT